MSLCVLHHRAYDRGLITFAPDYRVLISDKKIGELRGAGLDGGLDKFRERLREVIQVPAEKASRPRQDFIEKANLLRGWR